MGQNDSGNDGGKLLYCSFCGKNQNEVRKLIAGPSVYICDECVDLCNDIIQEEIAEDSQRLNLSVYLCLKRYVQLWMNMSSVNLKPK